MQRSERPPCSQELGVLRGAPDDRIVRLDSFIWMTILIPILIYLIIPFLGFLLHRKLCTVMDRRQVPEAPRLVLAILFVTYGGWLLVFLTLWLWYWSGLASLGLLYLRVVAPILLILLAVYLQPRRKVSTFHTATFFASAGYVTIPIAMLLLR